MSTTATATTTEAPLTPPEEQFWKRYSPHGEAPLSFAGSTALHLLTLGVLFMFGVWLASLFVSSKSNVPVEVVRLKIPGGGGGDKRHPGREGGPAPGALAEAVNDDGEDRITVPGADINAPKIEPLKDLQRQQIEKNFDPESARVLIDSNNPSARAAASVESNVLSQLRKGLQKQSGGQGGSGEGGGKDKGKGKGVGAGEGDGKAQLTQREKRMLRWHMKFTANTGPSYVAQLRALGAILAVPDKDGDYKIIRDLQAPAKLVSEDLDKIQRIYWIDDNPRSVRDVMGALGVPFVPNRFVAFMPQKLEDDLFKMERNYVEKVLRKKFEEDRIDETTFEVVHKGGTYHPELLRVTIR